MAGPEDYRTADEIAAYQFGDEMIQNILGDAVDDLASMDLAMTVGAEQEVVEHWVNRAHDRLRERLAPIEVGCPDPQCQYDRTEDLIRAIVLLLSPAAGAQACQVLNSVGGCE